MRFYFFIAFALISCSHNPVLLDEHFFKPIYLDYPLNSLPYCASSNIQEVEPPFGLTKQEVDKLTTFPYGALKNITDNADDHTLLSNKLYKEALLRNDINLITNIMKASLTRLPIADAGWDELSLLNIAARSNNLELLRFGILIGCNPNYTDTPHPKRPLTDTAYLNSLETASAFASPEAVDYLLTHGAELSASAVAYALTYINLPVISYYKAIGMDVRDSKYGGRALSIAINKNKADAVLFLLEAGAIPSKETLHEATKLQNQEIIKILIDYGYSLPSIGNIDEGVVWEEKNIP